MKLLLNNILQIVIFLVIADSSFSTDEKPDESKPYYPTRGSGSSVPSLEAITKGERSAAVSSYLDSKMSDAQIMQGLQRLYDRQGSLGNEPSDRKYQETITYIKNWFAGVDGREKKWWLIQHAIRQGHHLQFELLLDSDPSQAWYLVSHIDEKGFGWNCLHLAASYGYVKMVKRILNIAKNEGQELTIVSARTKNNKETPLDLAKKWDPTEGHEEIITELEKLSRELGAARNSKTKSIPVEDAQKIKKRLFKITKGD